MSLNEIDGHDATVVPTDRPYMNIVANSLYVNFVELQSTGATGSKFLNYYESGVSLSGTWTVAGGGGIGAPLSYSATITRIGNMVFICFNGSSSFGVTSGNVYLTLSSLATRFRPSATRVCTMPTAENSLPLVGECAVDNAGNISIYKNTIAGTWSAASNNSYGAFTISYPIT